MKYMEWLRKFKNNDEYDISLSEMILDSIPDKCDDMFSSILFVNASFELDNNNSIEDFFELIESQKDRKYVLDKDGISIHDYHMDKSTDLKVNFWGFSDATQEEFTEMFSSVYWVKYKSSSIEYYYSPPLKEGSRITFLSNEAAEKHSRYRIGCKVLQELKDNND